MNVLMMTGKITKTGTIAMNFYKPVGESNLYVRFGYAPLTIYYHTQRQVSESSNADTINMIHTSQKLKKIKPSLLPRPSTNLWGKQICISGLFTFHRNVSELRVLCILVGYCLELT